MLAIDNDPAAIATHAENFCGRAVCANIEEWLEQNDVPIADVVIGGPPCQGFSLLNKKRNGDQRRALWEPYMEIVRSSGARIFVMENVAELYRSPELEEIKQRAFEFGFLTDEHIVNAADYGAPQTRRRTIVIGWQRSIRPPQFLPLPTHAAPDTDSNRPTWRTVRDVIADLPPPTRTEFEGEAPP